MVAASHQSQAQPAHTPSASASSDHSSNEDLNWDGDTMFNVYIWDYCVKRGYNNTAREFAEEAKLDPNPRPPIDAKQGLLYEWWSVFWLLFTTKNNNQGPEEAMLYIQNHMAHPRMQQLPGAMPRYPNGLQRLPGAPGAMTAVPNSLGLPNQGPNPQPMPNGIRPSAPGQQQMGQPQGHGPLSQQQAPGGGQQQPQAPPPLGFPSQHPQPNGVPQHGRPPMPGQPQAGPGGAGQPGRPQLPMYQSPTMAHQQPGGPPPPYPGGPGPMGAAGMPSSMYPQPQHMRMLPPSAPNGVAGGGSPRFPQGNVGTGSRTPTPGQPGASGSSVTQPSPSMANRTVPATPPSFGGPPQPSGMAVVPGGQRPLFDQVNAEISKIDLATMNELRQELGLANKDTAALSMDEKSRIVNAYKQRSTAGPSNPPRSQPGRGAKRNSVSPADQHAEIPTKDESSPPAQKRARRSPEHATQSVSGPAGPAPQQGGPSNANANQNPPSGSMYPPMMANGMRPGPPFTPQMGPMGMGQPPPQNMMMAPGMVNQQLPFQKNQSYPGLQGTHKMGPGMTTLPSTPVLSTIAYVADTSPDSQQQMPPQFPGDPNQGRPAPPSFGGGQQRPAMNQQGRMLPPNSPATNANAPGQGKPQQNAQGTKQEGKVDSSPRNQPPPTPSVPSGPTPVSTASGPLGTSAPSPSMGNHSRPATATSNPTTGGSSAPQQTPNPPASAPPAQATSDPAMNFDFMSTGFDDFTSMFGRDEGNLADLDHDFGAWFGTTDITGLTDSLSR